MADSDVVHQDVDVAQCLEDLLHTSFEADGIGNIQQIETGTGLCCGLGPEDGIKVAEDYLIALSGKDFNDSFSDSVVHEIPRISVDNVARRKDGLPLLSKMG